MITLYSRMLDSCYYAAVIAGLVAGRRRSKDPLWRIVS